MSNLRRFPRLPDAPRPKPMCSQCSAEMARGWPKDIDYNAHELRAGSALNLRVFADHSDPHRIAVVTLRITDEGLRLNWLGDETIEVEWDDLRAILTQHIAAGGTE